MDKKRQNRNHEMTMAESFKKIFNFLNYKPGQKMSLEEEERERQKILGNGISA